MRPVGRKFKLAVWCELVFIGLLLYGELDAVQFIDLTKWCLGGYLGANVAHRAVSGVTDYLEAKREIA